jgi:predicted RNase H-like HicB family nuclease
MINHEHYTYRVIWWEPDKKYVGLCAEFPSLSYLDENQVEALKGIVELVGFVIEDMAANNELIPMPAEPMR